MNQLFDQFFKSEPIVLEGYLVKKAKENKDGFVTIQLYPGIILDIEKTHIKELEEATDPITGRTFLKLKISEDAEIRTVFQLRLARLALSRDENGIPYSFREDLNFGQKGSTVYVDPPVYSASREIPPFGPGGRPTYDTASIGEFDTRSNKHFYGWVNDDKRYTDTLQDGGGPVIV